MNKKFALILLLTFFSLSAFSQQSKPIAVFPPVFKNCSETDRNDFGLLSSRLVTALFDYSTFPDIFDYSTRGKLLNLIESIEKDITYDESTFLDLGRKKMNNANFMCYIKIVRIGNDEYNIYFNLLDTEKGIPLAIFEDDCDYQQIIDTDENSVVNRAVYKMLTQDIPEYANSEDMAALGRALENRKRNLAQYEAQRKKDAAKKERANRRAESKTKERNDSRKKHLSFLGMQDANPTNGFDFYGGYVAANYEEKKYISTGMMGLGFAISPAPFFGLGTEFNITFGLHDYDTTYDIVYLSMIFRADAHVAITRFLAPYVFAGLGFGILTSPDGPYDYEIPMGFAAEFGGGLYVMFTKKLKIHGDYRLLFNTRYIGWTDQVTFGFTWCPF